MKSKRIEHWLSSWKIGPSPEERIWVDCLLELKKLSVSICKCVIRSGTMAGWLHKPNMEPDVGGGAPASSRVSNAVRIRRTAPAFRAFGGLPGDREDRPGGVCGALSGPLTAPGGAHQRVHGPVRLVPALVVSLPGGCEEDAVRVARHLGEGDHVRRSVHRRHRDDVRCILGTPLAWHDRRVRDVGKARHLRFTPRSGHVRVRNAGPVVRGQTPVRIGRADEDPFVLDVAGQCRGPRDVAARRTAVGRRRVVLVVVALRIGLVVILHVHHQPGPQLLQIGGAGALPCLVSRLRKDREEDGSEYGNDRNNYEQLN